MASKPLRESNLIPLSGGLGWEMSVCIAALCENRKVIVAAADMLVTLGNYASDFGVVKNDVIFPRWAVMTAGDDIEHADAVIERATQLLTRKFVHKTPQQVADKLAQAFEERLQRQIATKILHRYGFTPATFRDTGKKKMTASAYNAIITKIGAERLRLSFLVCGQDKDGTGHILGIHEGGQPVSYDKMGYWAIGSGSDAALASLSFNGRQFRVAGALSLGECVYQVLAAKFMAESNGAVGKQTFLMVYGPEDGKARSLFLSDLEKIRQRWEKEGAPRIPQGIVEEIPTMLNNPNDPDYQGKNQKSMEEHTRMLMDKPSILER